MLHPGLLGHEGKLVTWTYPILYQPTIKPNTSADTELCGRLLRVSDDARTTATSVVTRQKQ